jgi:hypothetical protein
MAQKPNDFRFVWHSSLNECNRLFSSVGLENPPEFLGNLNHLGHAHTRFARRPIRISARSDQTAPALGEKLHCPFD